MMTDYALQKKVIIGVLLALFAADGALWYYGSRLAEDLQSPQTILSAEVRHINLMKEDIKRASAIKEKIPKYVAWFDDVEKGLPPEKEGYTTLLAEMGGYAKETKVLIEDTHYHPKELAGRDLVEVEIESTISGDYNGIVKFLNALQRSKNVYIVDTLGVDLANQNGPSQGPANALKVGLHLRTYFRKS